MFPAFSAFKCFIKISPQTDPYSSNSLPLLQLHLNNLFPRFFSSLWANQLCHQRVTDVGWIISLLKELRLVELSRALALFLYSFLGDIWKQLARFPNILDAVFKHLLTPTVESGRLVYTFRSKRYCSL